MAEKLISPGVFTAENDLSFIPAGVSEIGGAIVGPTVKGPALVPTTVNSYAEYVQMFGDVFTSGSTVTEYLTSISAREYLKHSGTLTVVRVLGAGYSNATSTILSSGSAATPLEKASGSVSILTANQGDTIRVVDGTTEIDFIGQASPNKDASNDSVRFFAKGANTNSFATNFATEFNSVNGLSAFTANATTGTIQITASLAGIVGNGLIVTTGSGTTFSTGFTTAGGTETAGSQINSFVLNTIADGANQNSTDTEGANNTLPLSGSKDNLRWEVTARNEKKGTFTLVIRRGNDSSKHKVILETHSGLSLDPNSSNYIGKRIGTQFNTLVSSVDDGTYLQPTGNFPNRSSYVYVSAITDTVDFLDPNGAVRVTAAQAKIPQIASGTFATGADGSGAPGEKMMFGSITAENNQGLQANAAGAAKGYDQYVNAFDLLGNQDDYDINLLWSPGLNNKDHPSLCAKIIATCESRGDCFAIIDPVGKGQTIATAVAQGGEEDSSYAAMYWPWIQTSANGRYVWTPASTLMPGVIAFNDKVSHEWYAPAGLNRGGLSSAVQAERKLTHANRDTLYEAAINPLATFPGEGVCAWGQKTLQRKASALDRVNVRRLLINLKKFIASTSRYLVFENNTNATRNRFLASVNPYMESVQEKNGLYAFKVVMDDSNNTADIIDRNIMKGEIYLQPAKAAEFIVVDFNIMPTGATFED